MDQGDASSSLFMENGSINSSVCFFFFSISWWFHMAYVQAANFPAYFCLSPLQKHVRKVVGGNQPTNLYTSRRWFNLLYHTIQSFNDPEEETFRKHCGEKEKMLVTSIFSFSHNGFYCIKDKFCHFSNRLICCLRMLWIWTSLKFLSFCKR